VRFTADFFLVICVAIVAGSGAARRDPGPIDRISRAYGRRMGR